MGVAGFFFSRFFPFTSPQFRDIDLSSRGPRFLGLLKGKEKKQAIAS